MLIQGAKLDTKLYMCIDLKSFYASVECVEQGLDPMDTNLVVADASRTTKTICLAVTPALKSYGVSGRPRLFEVLQVVDNVNSERIKYTHHGFTGKSYLKSILDKNPTYELEFIAAPPRMAYYIEYSTRIYKIYLKYIAPEDIHVYSIDEVFIDITGYLKLYKCSAYDLAKNIIKDIFDTTGITSTAGIGTNMYLAKVAMDIVAKTIPADKDGVRISYLDELSYREKLWTHTPLTDFWRVGPGYARKLEDHGIYTMGDIAKCSVGDEYSIRNEELLYKLFGVNAELLIDHAWGYEPATIKDVKSYKPDNKCIGSGQVLQSAYSYDEAKIVVKEMTDLLSLDIVEKKVLTNQIVLHISYDADNLKIEGIVNKYNGEITVDSYGRPRPKSAHGTINLEEFTSSTHKLVQAVSALYEHIVNPILLVRKVSITFNNITSESSPKITKKQLTIFDFLEDDDVEEKEKKLEEEKKLKKEKDVQEVMIEIKKRFGKNSILKGVNLTEGSTARSKNNQIGGHRA